jgi:hypothetical protein
MTCEVVVANRMGIALAADSAVTFTNGNSETATYASGANKIFQLAASEPVAVMVYSSADLNRIPWEVILKRYRKELGATTFDALSLYADDLIDFINSRTPKLLPPVVREAGTTSAATDAVLYALAQVMAARPRLADAAADPATLQAEWTSGFDDVKHSLDGVPVDPCLDPADLETLRGAVAAHLATQLLPFLNGSQEHSHLAGVVDCLALVHLGLQFLFCRPQLVLSRYTGVVVSGYGVDDFMLGFVDVHVYGFVGSRIYWRTGLSIAVNNTDKSAFIEPFARKSMVETFTQGASPEVWRAVREAFVTHAEQVATKAAAASGVAINQVDIDAAIQTELNPFTHNWAVSVLQSHLMPLNNVIGSLNVEELAELAETMVMLESLKEKVTSRTQGVGGPIDVAMITKSEGLVWIKRKHYFNPEINQRYLLRLQRGV